MSLPCKAMFLGFCFTSYHLRKLTVRLLTVDLKTKVQYSVYEITPLNGYSLASY